MPYFDYENSCYISDDEIKKMKKQIKRGMEPEEVFENYREEQDDAKYYELDYVRDQVIDLIKNYLDSKTKSAIIDTSKEKTHKPEKEKE